MQGIKAQKFNGPIDCFLQIIRKEGFRGLYKGSVPRLSRVVLNVGLTFTLFEYIKSGMDYLIPDEIK